MLLLLATPALAAPSIPWYRAASEEVCVEADVQGAPLHLEPVAPSLADLRRAVLLKEDPREVPLVVDEVLRYVPSLRPGPAEGPVVVHLESAEHPVQPGRQLVDVELVVQPPSSAVQVPQQVTLLVDTSASMSSSVLPALPLLHDGDPRRGGTIGVDRTELAKVVLADLADLLPSDAVVSLVVFEGHDGEVVLEPTSASDRQALKGATEWVVHGIVDGGTSALEVSYQTAVAARIPCADNRILLLTDDNARLHADAKLTDKVVSHWAEHDLRLWTLALGVGNDPVPHVEALTRLGRGSLGRAETRREAELVLERALRRRSVAVRDAALEVRFDPATVYAWRRVGAGARAGDGPWRSAALAPSDVWTLPEIMHADDRSSALYEVVPQTGAAARVEVAWSAGSPVPGEWEVVDSRAAPEAGPLGEAGPTLRHRVAAAIFAEAVGGAPQHADLSPRQLDALLYELAPEPGVLDELRGIVQIWAENERGRR